MMARPVKPSLRDLLPPIRGRIQEAVALAPSTWLRVGGPAEFLVRPADVADLQALLSGMPDELPVTVLGAASNLIIRDGGIQGVVIRLARGFAEVTLDGGDGLVAGAACLDAAVAEHAAAAGLSSLEFLSGIPGSIGGAVAMNAGAYGGDMAGCLDWVELVTAEGELVRLSAAALNFAYRVAVLPPGGVVVRARLRAVPGEPAAIAARMAEIRKNRMATQPRARTGGSTFRNPPDSRAWELIDAAGGRGLSRGAAQMSEQHCNFMINTGGATAADLEGLGEEIRRRVHAMSGVSLEWEIRRLGVPGEMRGLVA